MTHSYSEKVSMSIGIPAAVVLWRLCERVLENMDSGTGCFNGKWYTEATAERLQEELPDLTISQVRYAFGKLTKNGMIAAASFASGHKYNTKWYTVTPYGWSCMDDAKVALGVR